MIILVSSDLRVYESKTCPEDRAINFLMGFNMDGACHYSI